MSGGDVLGAVAGLSVALSVAGAEVIAVFRGRRARIAQRRAWVATTAVREPAVVEVAEPIKLPVTPANRAMRARRANVVWTLPDWSIADKLGPYDAEFTDLQALAELFASDEAER